MSFEAMAWAVKQDLPVKQKITLLMLANRVNSDTGRCFPSMKGLARDCGMSETSVKEAIRALKAAGLLVAHERRFEGVSLTNEYELPTDEIPPPRRNTPHPPGVIRPTPRRNTPPNLEDNLSSEPSLFESGNLPVEEINAAEPKVDHFAEFWAAYPKCQRKTDRAKAMAVFRQITEGKHRAIQKTDPAAIIAGIKAYAAKDPDPKFIPLPTTWLNGERWDAFVPEEDPEVAAYRAKMQAITARAQAAQGGRA